MPGLLEWISQSQGLLYEQYLANRHGPTEEAPMVGHYAASPGDRGHRVRRRRCRGRRRAWSQLRIQAPREPRHHDTYWIRPDSTDGHLDVRRPTDDNPHDLGRQPSSDGRPTITADSMPSLDGHCAFTFDAIHGSSLSGTPKKSWEAEGRWRAAGKPLRPLRLASQDLRMERR